MGKRKGLFHIVEIVIITIIMFVMIVQISSIPKTGAGLGSIRLSSTASDVLFSIEESGTDWSDEAAVARIIDYAFNGTNVMYGLTYSGAPKKIIRVGCLCDDGPECTSLCSWLGSEISAHPTYSFNNLSVRIDFSNTSSIGMDYDVIVTDMSLETQDLFLSRFLADGRGFVLVRDLSIITDFNNYGGVLDDYFAVDRSSSGSGNVVFETTDYMLDPYYHGIYAYFGSIPNSTGGRYNLSHVFPAFSSDPVNKSEGRGRVILETASGQPSCIANYGASGNAGRAAWLSESARTDDWSVFLRSLIIWASSHERQVAGDETGTSTNSAHIYNMPDDYNRADYMFQPYRIVLDIGYLYQ